MVDYRIELEPIRSGFDGRTCWVHARCGIVPRGGAPLAVLTAQQLVLSGSDVFHGLHAATSEDRGASWSELREQHALKRWTESDGTEAVVCDFTPAWHEATGMLLGIGHTARYQGDRLQPPPRPVETAWSTFDLDSRQWTKPKLLTPPNKRAWFRTSAGCSQRLDLEDGSILLPLSHRGKSDDDSVGTVCRCVFDGERLEVREQGNELKVEGGRGLGELSLARLRSRFFLTCRNDEKGYVAVSEDGLEYTEPAPWCFDDGSELGNYNTQQHWVSHPEGLYLVYTRRAADNDHVFRHRAPLFIARVDAERLCVIRETERVLVPQRGARLGNFGVCRVDGAETWVTAAEWMQPVGCEAYGSDNTIWLARILWTEE